MYDDRNYMIFNISELDSIDFNSVLETGPETVRRNIDETKTFVKWEGEMPDCVNSLNSKEGPYSYEEMITLLNSEEWTQRLPIHE